MKLNGTYFQLNTYLDSYQQEHNCDEKVAFESIKSELKQAIKEFGYNTNDGLNGLLKTAKLAELASQVGHKDALGLKGKKRAFVVHCNTLCKSVEDYEGDRKEALSVTYYLPYLLAKHVDDEMFDQIWSVASKFVDSVHFENRNFPVMTALKDDTNGFLQTEDGTDFINWVEKVAQEDVRFVSAPYSYDDYKQAQEYDYEEI